VATGGLVEEVRQALASFQPLAAASTSSAMRS